MPEKNLLRHLKRFSFTLPGPLAKETASWSYRERWDQHCPFCLITCSNPTTAGAWNLSLPVVALSMVGLTPYRVLSSSPQSTWVPTNSYVSGTVPGKAWSPGLSLHGKNIFKTLLTDGMKMWLWLKNNLFLTALFSSKELSEYRKEFTGSLHFLCFRSLIAITFYFNMSKFRGFLPTSLLEAQWNLCNGGFKMTMERQHFCIFSFESKCFIKRRC